MKPARSFASAARSSRPSRPPQRPSRFTPHRPERLDSSRTSDRSPTESSKYSRPPSHLSPRLDSPAYEPTFTRSPRREIQRVADNSEWIFGTFVVEAALKARRRKFYRLYVYAGEARTPIARDRDLRMKRMAEQLGIEVVQESDRGKMDSMSNSRPHNGYVLECTPLEKIPILSLGNVAKDKTSFDVQLAQHSPTGVDMKTLSPTIHCRDPKRRYPFVLMLDEILDPGNMGALLRTAYYLGTDAVVLSERNCAPLNAVCLKTSAGAAEFLPIYSHSQAPRLLSRSADAGWTTYAAVPSPTKNQLRRDNYVLASDVGKALETGPTLLCLGSEGVGIRDGVMREVMKKVSIDRAPGTESLVDSLNVSVAGALLCQAFLHPQKTPPPAENLGW